ncbi:MAG: prenyltransferase [Betaproteobacteria bacterium]|nr:prenyltransferase [Betaproteobacteria bacterium]
MPTVPRSKAALWLGAFAGFYRPGVEELRLLDPVSKFLYAARSVILVISAQAAIIAGLLAAADGRFRAGAFVLVLLGLVVAHMISNLSNDYFGYKRGHDTPDSPRMRYTVHPLASGVLERRDLLVGLALLAALGSAIAAWFIVERGWLAAGFVAAGIALMLLYDAAPVPLKSVGLGEVAVFLVWGPLMVGGGYAVIAGRVSADAFYASIPYGLGVMSILTGKHIDQREFDAGKGNRTLPVLLGERAARGVNVATLALIYVVIALLILWGRLTLFAALAALALPSAARAVALMRRPRPAAAPPGYVGWPLWYHRVCLQHNRLFGWLYIAGLAAGALWSVAGR